METTFESPNSVLEWAQTNCDPVHSFWFCAAYTTSLRWFLFSKGRQTKKCQSVCLDITNSMPMVFVRPRVKAFNSWTERLKETHLFILQVQTNTAVSTRGQKTATKGQKTAAKKYNGIWSLEHFCTNACKYNTQCEMTLTNNNVDWYQFQTIPFFFLVVTWKKKIRNMSNFQWSFTSIDAPGEDIPAQFFKVFAVVLYANSNEMNCHATNYSCDVDTLFIFLQSGFVFDFFILLCALLSVMCQTSNQHHKITRWKCTLPATCWRLGYSFPE